jgi:uncharacterized membrane protein YbhN (UPF0104 family)
VNLRNRFDALIEGIEKRPPPLADTRVRRFALLVAAVMLLSGMALSIAARPSLLKDLAPLPWLFLLACVPLTIGGNAAQFRATAWLIGVHVSWRRATVISVLSTAANMLPLPGGSIVRIAALKTASNSYVNTAGATMLTAGNWLGVSMTIAAIALAYKGNTSAALVLLSAGICIIAIAAALLGALGTVTVTARFAGLCGVQIATTAIGALRLVLCFLALDEVVSFADSLVLSLSAVFAAFIGVAPGGIGVVEGIAAAIASMIGVSAAATFVAATINRIASLLVIAPLALSLARRNSDFIGSSSNGGGHP